MRLFTFTFLITSLISFSSFSQQKFDALTLLNDIKTLSSDEFEGRKTGTPGNIKAQDYIIKRFVSYGLIPFDGKYKHDFTFTKNNKNIKGSNIIAKIEGKKDPNKFVAITAHYDHLGKRDGEVYNGADDNASGVAGMFSIAEYYKKNTPDYSILFIAFDAEEAGLKGAKAFVERPPIDLKNLITIVNIDMISINDKHELYACGTYHYPFLKPYIEEIAYNNKYVKIKYGHDEPASTGSGLDDWTYASDHGPFHKAGIPFIYFGVEDHAHYHKPNDTFDKINQVFFINSVDLVIDLIANFDKNLSQLEKERDLHDQKKNK